MKEITVLENKTVRIPYIDLLRGFGILLMVMGHIFHGDIFLIWIHGFHMPLFYFVSGYFFKDNITIKKAIIKKAKTTMVPYFAFGLFYYVVWLVMIKNFAWWVPLKSLFFTPTDGNLPITVAIWFLPSLYITEITFFILRKYIKSEKVLSLIILILFLSGVLIPKYVIRLPWTIDTSMVGMGFYYIAYLMNKYDNKKTINYLINAKSMIALVYGAIGSCAIFFNGNTGIYSGKYGNSIILYLVGALLMILFLWNISRSIYQTGKMKMVINILTKIGQTSISYVCMNQFVILICKRLLPYRGIFYEFIILSMSMTAIFLVDFIIRKCKLGFVLGEKKKAL